MSFFRGRSQSAPDQPAFSQDNRKTGRRASDPDDTRQPGKTLLHGWLHRQNRPSNGSAIEDEPSPPPTPPKELCKGHGPTDDDRYLSRKDLHSLFVGAPYFILEKGRFGQWHPQVIFPWSDHDVALQSLLDRKPLPHASCAPCTLHAHLPVPDGYAVKGDTPVYLDGAERTSSSGPRRAIFDIGVFEIPNMLCANGKEPGSVGFRHFLELPVADSVRYTGPELPRPRPDLRHLLTMPAAEAFESIEHHTNDPYAQCRDGTVHDRKRLLCEGPPAWKKIGVRDPGLDSLVDRLETLRTLRQNMLYTEIEKTILDAEPLSKLHQDLFNKFLHHPPRSVLGDREDPSSLKTQIRLLTTVLATPGAWFDFNLEEWRLRAGQILWETPPHRDGDYLHPGECEDAQRKSWVIHGLERKWLLLQMLLAGELLLRLDAMIRVGVIDSETGVSMGEVHEFDRLRNRKVNWDLIVVRRFLDSFSFSKYEAEASCISPPQGPEKLPKHHHRSLKEVFSRHRSSVPTAVDIESAWGCRLTPFHVNQQLQGLFVFAENIGWPRLDVLKAHLQHMLGDEPQQTAQELYSRPLHPPTDPAVRLNRVAMYSRSPSCRQVVLQDASDRSMGWITRSWLSGFIAPGESTGALLLATVVENDPDVLATLGPLANLYGGFSYQGQSWWSKQCVVGRVLSSLPGNHTQECMGWMKSDNIVPVEASTSKPLDGTWFEVRVKEALPTCSKKPRIKQGHKISSKSTPLGEGDLSREAFSMPVDHPGGGGEGREAMEDVEFDSLTVVAEEGADGRTVAIYDPTLWFNGSSMGRVSWPLSHNVHFITSYHCRPPPGQINAHTHSHLAGHPLHATYSYRYVPLSALPSTGAPQRLQRGIEGRGKPGEVLVVDARGSRTRETFARAWCASVGSHAVIGREGRSCVACCIREAQAVDVGVVIRV